MCWIKLNWLGVVNANIFGNDKFLFYWLYIARKIKYVLTIDKDGTVQKYTTLRGFDHSKRLLDRSQNFKTIDG